jgi:hypothetical protein
MADELFAQLTDTLSSAKTVEDLTRPLLSLLELVTELEATYLTRIELEHGIQRILFSRNTKTLTIPEGLAVPWEGTLCKRALDEGKLYKGLLRDGLPGQTPPCGIFRHKAPTRPGGTVIGVKSFLRCLTIGHSLV